MKRIDYGIFHHPLIFRQFFQRLTASLCAVVLALQSGCSTPGPRTQYQSTLGKVAVVVSAQQPKFVTLDSIFPSKDGGAAGGAGAGVVACLGTSFECGPIFGLCAVLCSVVMVPVGAVIGAVEQGIRTKEVLDVEPEDIDARVAQGLLRDQVVAAAMAKGVSLVPFSPESPQSVTQWHDYHPLAAAGIDTVLEVALTKVGFERGVSGNPALKDQAFLIMTAHVRLIRTGDNVAVFTADYVYQSEFLTRSEWLGNQAGRLLHALQVGYETLGSSIYDNIFLLYPFPYRNLLQAQEGDLIGPYAFGLAPLYPRASFGRLIYGMAKIDSLRPTLCWQSFPRGTDFMAAPDEMVMGRVKNVRYDLIIAQAGNHDVVYRREGLLDAMHTIETSLSPSSHYLWSVRARFEFDGREQVTEWGSFQYGEQVVTPSRESYSFETPE